MRSLLASTLNEIEHRTQAMGARTAKSIGARGVSALVAASLSVLLVVDPFGLGPLVLGLQADPIDSGDLSRSERVDAIVDGLNLDEPVTATPVTGSWDAVPDESELPSLPTDLPTEDEEVVVLSEEEGGGTALASFVVRSVADALRALFDDDPFEIELGGMPVSVTPADSGLSPDAVRLQVAGETETELAGITGVLLDVSDASGEETDEDAEVDLTLSYASFAGLGSGDWASRLRFVWIPDCDAGVTNCVPLPIETVNDPETQTVHATVPVEPGINPVVTLVSFQTGVSAKTGEESGGGSLAVTAGASGSSGDWGATSLSSASTWGAGESSGTFSWSLALSVPLVGPGPSPSLAFSYSSAGSDGRTPASNNQSGLMGEGFDLTTSYVERSYVPCSGDEESEPGKGVPNNVDRVSGDLCWGADNATLVFNGSSIELVKDAAGNWHGKNEDGSLIERKTGSWNGGHENEYWEVTTTDGSHYFFGRGQRSATDTAALNSAWTVPVYGNHATEPCHHTAFSGSDCNQVWRWNLEYVLDVSGNSMTYFYTKESNKYVYDVEGNTDGATTSYTSGGRLDHIEYGIRTGTPSKSSAMVTLTTTPRCLTSYADPASFCNSNQSSTTSNKWPDTPTDMICGSGECTNYSPVFFDRYRLSAINTFTYDGSVYQPVDTWDIEQRFVEQGGGTNVDHASGVMLVTTGVTHTGKGGNSSSLDDESLPMNQFHYTSLANRVDLEGTYQEALARPRLTHLQTEAGASVSVNYHTECSSSDKPATTEAAQEANTKLCYAVKWSPSDYADPITEYFHKYVVESIIESGAPPAPDDETVLITGSVAKETSFTYGGGAAWRKPTGAMVEESEVTFSDFRGFAEVTTTIGVGNESSSTKNVYFRGLEGTVTAGPTSNPVAVVDTFERRGKLFDSVVLNGTTLISETVSVPTDVVTVTDSNENTASRISTMETFGFSYVPTELHPEGVLEYRTGTKIIYDSNAQVESIDDFGDRDITADEVCTTYTYAHTTNANLESDRLLGLVAQTDVVKGSCGGTPSLPADLLSSTKTTYDEFGRPVQSSTIDPNDGVDYVLTSEVLEYDSRGRPLRVADAFGQISTLSYQDSPEGLPRSTTSTTPDPDGAGPLSGFVSRSEFYPLTGLRKSATDMNGRVTSGTYDSLGRLLTVRYPQHQSSPVPSVQYEYEVHLNGLNSVATKTLAADGVTQHLAVTLYDGLLRAFQTQIEGADAGADHNAGATARGRMVSDVYYDSAGRVSRQTGQWLTAGAPEAAPVYSDDALPSETTFDYDAAGRTVDEVFWVGNTKKWHTFTDYHGKTTLTIPPMGGTPRAIEVDARGRTVKLTEYLRDADVHASMDLPDEVRELSHQSTTYVYDTIGNLIEVSDPDENVWSYEYDLAGRQTSATDQDAGTSSTTYDVAGRLVTHKDGNGVTLAYTYDALGRKTSMRDTATPLAARVEWTYDQATDPSISRASDPTNHQVLGQMSSSTRIVDGAAYTTSIPRYDAAYRPVETKVSLPDIPAFAALDSKTFSTLYTYMADGQVASVSLPAVASGGVRTLGSEIVTTRYDTAGIASWMSGGFGWGTYVAESRFASDGRQVLADLGNTYGEIVSYRYEDGTKRLTSVSLDREGVTGSDVNLTYAYDDAGNVLSIKDQPTAATVSGVAHQDNQCFGFDGLRRLTSAFTALGGDCTAGADGVTVAEVGGVAPYWTDYSYDVLGNRTQLVEHATGGATSTATTTYTHGIGAAGPHQVTGVSRTSSESTSASEYTYDAAGNRDSAITDGATVDYLWDAEGELAGVDGEHYTYDASGNRLVRTDASGTTVYLPGGQEITIGVSTVSATRYYSFAGQTVAMRTGSGMAAVSSLLSDQHGSVVAAVPNTAVPDSTAVQRWFSAPFGGDRAGAATTIANDHRFLGAVRDSGSGLTLLSARYYDEAVGQFISVDPLLDTGEPAQFNAYSYAFNNPVTLSDPSGLDPKDHQIAQVAAQSNYNKWLAGGCGGNDSGGVEDFLQWAANTSTLTDRVHHPTPEQQAATPIVGFTVDDDGTYYTTPDAPQYLLGYDLIMDLALDIGTTSNAVAFPYPCGDHSCIVWFWKAFYITMGPGGEGGHYTQTGLFNGQRPHWDPTAEGDPHIPSMTVTIQRAGAGADEPPIAYFDPSDPQQRWNGAYASRALPMCAGDIVATFAITFPNSDDYQSFIDTRRVAEDKTDSWSTNDRTNTATLTWH